MSQYLSHPHAEAPVIDADPMDDYAVIARVACPFCNGTHQHGIPAGDLDVDVFGSYGGRIADCAEGGQYLITDPDSMVLRSRLTEKRVKA